MELKKEIIQKICKPILDKGFSIFFVGGCVRDSLLGIEPQDFDLTTDATPSQLHTIFSKFSKKSTGAEKYNTTIIVIELQNEMQEVEITTFRTDASGRHPDTFYAKTIQEDCTRRDFTINALYEDAFGNIFDPTGLGKKDVKHGFLRFIGNPIDRLKEDPLRAFRFVRFLSQKDLVSSYSISELKSFAEQLSFKEVSKERQLKELKKILAGTFFTELRVWEAFFALGIAKEVGIESLMLDMQKVPQAYRWHAEGSVWIKDGIQKRFEEFELEWYKGKPLHLEYLHGWVPLQNGTVWDHTKHVVENTVSFLNTRTHWFDEIVYDEQDRFEMVLGAFLHDIGKVHSQLNEIKHQEYSLFKDTEFEIFITEDVPRVSDHPIAGIPYAIEFCKNLKLSNKEIEFIVNVVEHHMTVHLLLERSSIFDKREILNFPQFDKLAVVCGADDVGSLNIVPNERGTMEVILEDEEIKRLRALGPLESPVLTGEYLIEMGRKPSSIFQKVLRAAWKIQINKGITDKKELYKNVKSIFKLESWND